MSSIRSAAASLVNTELSPPDRITAVKPIEKHFVSANQLLEDSFKLADMVHKSAFKPTLVLGIWRGGAPIAIAVHEYLAYRGARLDHAVIGAKSYTGINEQSEQVKVTGLDTLKELLSNDSRVLLVDDIFDTGRTMEGAIDSLRQLEGCQNIAIKVACPWYKPSRNLTSLQPDYFINETAEWIVFPHELVGLEDSDIKKHKPKVLEP